MRIYQYWLPLLGWERWSLSLNLVISEGKWFASFAISPLSAFFHGHLLNLSSKYVLNLHPQAKIHSPDF